MADRRFINGITPQTVIGPAVSAAIGCSDIRVVNATACFICVSANGLGTDGGVVGIANAHYLPAGVPLVLSQLDSTHKVGVSAGTLYISAMA